MSPNLSVPSFLIVSHLAPRARVHMSLQLGVSKDTCALTDPSLVVSSPTHFGAWERVHHSNLICSAASKRCWTIFTAIFDKRCNITVCNAPAKELLHPTLILLYHSLQLPSLAAALHNSLLLPWLLPWLAALELLHIWQILLLMVLCAHAYLSVSNGGG